MIPLPKDVVAHGNSIQANFVSSISLAAWLGRLLIPERQ